jgi:hypothetical protein
VGIKKTYCFLCKSKQEHHGNCNLKVHGTLGVQDQLCIFLFT